jgi:MFS transporter, DHA2 family, metal-tetracycline-proton antiporter
MEKSLSTTSRESASLVPWIAFLIFFAVLNETVFNVSTPAIAARFSLTSSGVSWMMTIFMIFFGVGSVLFGKLSDIYSLRPLIFVGVIGYVAASILGFSFHSSYPAVVAARALQGLGGSAIPALVFVVIARRFEASERGRIFGLITSIVSLAIGFGPVIGGFVASRLDWSYLFLLPSLILIALPFLARLLPREARKEGRVDIIGAILAVAAVGLLTMSLNFWSPYYLAGFAVAAALFALRMRFAAEPFIRLALFRNPGFRAGVLAAFCLFSIVIGSVFLVPLMLSELHGLGAQAIGLVLFPGAISSVLAGPASGRLADRRGNPFAVALGLALLFASLAALSLTLSISPLFVAAAMVLNYVGFAFAQTAMVNAVSQTLPIEDMGVGMGVFNFAGTLAGAIGAAVVGKLLASKLLDFSLFAAHGAAFNHSYGNLAALFALACILIGAAYLRSARASASAAGNREEIARQACLEAAGC